MSDPLAAARGISQSQRASEIAAAVAGFADDELARAVASANRTHMARVVAAAAACGMSSPNAYDCLRSYNPYVAETINVTDDTIFVLEGWRYSITVSATFAEGGTVRLIARGDVVWATFTESGTITMELPYGNFRFVAADATDLQAQITSATYE